jgi:hypothetical protein
MGSVQADICLRPLRIGLVVDPNNMEDVRQVMRASVTVWGGQFNPIIPAAGRIPPVWRDKFHRAMTSPQIAQGYPYPQGKLDKNNANFRYRVVGPFAVPDFAQGAYGSLLSLQALAGVSFHDGLTHSPGVKVTLDGKEFEIDFVGFWSPGELSDVTNPTLVFGESKSFGKDDLFKQRDFERLKAIGARFPGSVLVISVMRDSLTPKEIAQISKLAVWGRRRTRSGEISNPVIVLTGRELFADGPLQHVWNPRRTM